MENVLCFYLQFDFVNCFISLFYVAFYLQDMTLLRSVSIVFIYLIKMSVVSEGVLNI